MKKTKISSKHIIYLVTLLMLIPFSAEAQRMKHRSGGNVNGTKQNVTRNKKSINGGYHKPTQRDYTRKNTAPKVNTQQKKKVNKTNIKENNARVNTKTKNVNVDNRNRNVNRNVNVNVDRSRNINVHNRYVAVRPPVRPYRRPPYHYGGFRFYTFHPYHYHPYRPFYWGPVYHPWGFFVAALAVTAIVITVENQKYHYDEGVYYVESDGGYTVVEAPVGATIKVLPEGSETVVVNETTNNYYYGGTYYEKTGEEYTVVPPTAGTVVENLPEGGEEVKVGDVTYVKYGDTYYQPIQKDGKNMYEVVNVEEDNQ
jgi:hypothetical protein